IGKYFVENREQVAYDSINPFLIKSTIAVEDARFFDHNGIDYKALWRVGIKTIIMGEKQSGGGSTITQQLAKLLYKRPEIQNLSSLKSKFTLIHIKLKEWVTAIKLEHNYTKEEILAIYLNKFEFVNGAHGIQSAARIYFNKDQKDLSIEECALLTGMLQNPSYYNPVRFSKRAKIRRNEVIQKVMAGQDPNIIDSLQETAIDMSRFRTQEPTEGPAPYFRNEVTKIITEIFDENGIKKPDGSPYNVYLDGLKIYTSIDLEYQSIAEEAMSDHMTWLQDRFWKFWKTRDPL
nr:biosynthetic peptidoglycan transglycosylase [Saprospiraceae bacterium]